MDIVDPEDYREALTDIAREEPHTMARARRVVTNARLAHCAGPEERQIAWHLLLADRRLRASPPAARTGATA